MPRKNIKGHTRINAQSGGGGGAGWGCWVGLLGGMFGGAGNLTFGFNIWYFPTREAD